MLTGMLGLAVSHGALPANPMRDTATSARESKREVQFLTVSQAQTLRHLVRRSSMRVEGRRMANVDLEELVDVLLGTGCREGEALAIRPRDLIDLDGTVPMLHVCGTLVEPRGGFVEVLHRQDTTKSREDRTLILPDRVVEVLKRRIDRTPPADPDAPIFGTRFGTWISPSNMRTRLRRALSRAEAADPVTADDLAGTTFHTLRRTVGTLIAHEISLDAARAQLGHRDPSVTFQHYVGRRAVAPDVRTILDRLLGDLPATGSGTLPCRDSSHRAPGVTLPTRLQRSGDPERHPPPTDMRPRGIGR
ncbi:tyrosine-type recombinase/integrase [Nocardioides zhouii]|uniref:tyrosine-type recombinase/integrase n=1 Tax=Nocardioides zhouii TaxID=1168729 RepID=UPI0013E9FCB4|nr:tyrosine-type recombinase/integrase [Nocardioides zhouii]